MNGPPPEYEDDELITPDKLLKLTPLIGFTSDLDSHDFGDYMLRRIPEEKREAVLDWANGNLSSMVLRIHRRWMRPTHCLLTEVNSDSEYRFILNTRLLVNVAHRAIRQRPRTQR